MRDLRHAGEVDHLEQRVGGRLEKAQPRLGAHGGAPLVEIGAVHQRDRDAEARTERLDDVKAGAEQRPRRDQMVSGAELAHQRRMHRRHARGGGEPRFRALERGHAILEHPHSRVAVAGIDEALRLAGKAGLGLGRRGVDEPLRQIERLGCLAVMAARGAAMHQTGARPVSVGHRLSGGARPPRISGTGEQSAPRRGGSTSLAACLPWPAIRSDKSPQASSTALGGEGQAGGVHRRRSARPYGATDVSLPGRLWIFAAEPPIPGVSRRERSGCRPADIRASK